MVHPVKTCRKLKWYILSGSILGQTYILTSLPPYNPAVLQPKILGWWGLRLGVKNSLLLGCHRRSDTSEVYTRRR